MVVTGRSGNHYRLADCGVMDQAGLEFHVSNILSGVFSLGGQTDRAIIEYRVNFDPVFEQITFRGVPDMRIIVLTGYAARDHGTQFRTHGPRIRRCRHRARSRSRAHDTGDQCPPWPEHTISPTGPVVLPQGLAFRPVRQSAQRAHGSGRALPSFQALPPNESLR